MLKSAFLKYFNMMLCTLPILTQTIRLTNTTPTIPIFLPKPLWRRCLSARFFGYLNDTLLNVALTPIMKDFGVDKTTVQWLTTGLFTGDGRVHADYGGRDSMV